MEPERNEVYERIPWETLDRGGGDRQWLVIAVAGAIAVGALAFSFMRGQPAPTAAPAPVTVPPVAPSSVSQTPALEGAPTTVAAPLVVAEADLYAVDTDRLVDLAAAHAEWFAVEFLSVDGSDQSRQTLAALLPTGIPLPEAPEGTQVFVDWAGARSVVETTPLTYEVEVAVRSLVARGDGGFVRQPVTVMEVLVAVSEDGLPRVIQPPRLIESPPPSSAPISLAPVPEAIETQVASTHGAVVGGVAQPDGTWLVVAMVTGADQVMRPVAIAVPQPDD